MAGILVLEDGRSFTGEPFGAAVESAGEVVFNTGMTGYQEVLTDPSYAGQIVTMTYPLIGNYGINPADFESARPHVRGFVVREVCHDPSHWQATMSVDQYLRQHGIPGLSGVDTRALTRHLRSRGTLRGLISTIAPSGAARDEAFVRAAGERARALDLSRVAIEASTPTAYRAAPADGAPPQPGAPRVVVVDFGVKQNIVRSLMALGADVYVVPATATLAEIMALQPDGVLLSNGPGDPKDLPEAIEVARGLVERLPVFGICLGHQILGLALGADTYKLKYGHRGANHPVKDLASGRVYITSQNHGYAIDPKSLSGLPLKVTHVNLNDETVEGMCHDELPVFSVQYHPEAAPGPRENRYLFERFLAAVNDRRCARQRESPGPGAREAAAAAARGAARDGG